MAAYDYDPDLALAHLAQRDPVMEALIDRVGSFSLRLKPSHSVFLALAESIVYQQLHGKAAAAIFGRLRALFSDAPRGFKPSHVLAASDESLRGAGLSRGKTLALRDLAAKTESGELPTLAKLRRMDDEAIVETLTVVRGIGRWTVEMLLMFRLGRPDVLPVGDFGVRNGFRLAYKKRVMPTPKQLEKFGERWKPYRSVASWYLWRATEL